LALCPALFIHAATTSSGDVKPAAMFSPHAQTGLYPAAAIRPQAEEPSEPVWLKKSWSAMSWLWRSAAAFNAASLMRGGKPALALSWLVSSITRSANVAAAASGVARPASSPVGSTRTPPLSDSARPAATGPFVVATATAASANRTSSPCRKTVLPGPRTRILVKGITVCQNGLRLPRAVPGSARPSMPLVPFSDKSASARES